jgi:hypothetical protein
MEIWLPIKNYENYYEVSSLGRVRSVERTVKQYSKNGLTYQRVMKSKLITPVKDSKDRYMYVHLSNGIAKHFSIHSLVLKAFVGEPKQLQECCHLDGNCKNNRLDNLRWDSHLNNEKDKELHNRVYKGESHHNTSLTVDQVKLIKKSLSEYVGSKYGRNVKIGNMLSICPLIIGDISRNRTWKHVSI